ncbi:MAG: hypothetical protein A2087_06180 [Spirochaetes bacterium GWD1_61_31]|nr:MAG: hypothetical protein A2Y37_01185 [Spirochaetes bacterium GWB1_60_80]OHD35223.1 MAG: hypothetical protein A2004_11340 [Spirochaetes bacterium GWC1_61_12]OHD41781.1 MAG: hypothetical protein A2087_06180 [Spirochaetes bacterium GWD1_61_31]OHD42587.1 MAG: hypothetical protein A2Y35_07700 [Spirochaetes bacterium GWE1_60_18]OHD59816.1 MAG: hypothetical protein A2Y32_01465 [Spirochaetes bacterium GWF1_60_12]HAP44169.1 hypothetical protein [Spirochaetaceae bacterium]
MTEPTISQLQASLETNLFLSNTLLEIHSWLPATLLTDLVEHSDGLRQELLDQVGRLGWDESVVTTIGAAWLERIQSGLLAQYGFAYNLFRMAEDNWFSFQRAVDAAGWFAEPSYLKDRRELWLAKAVSTRSLLDDRSVPPDLMVVADLGSGWLHFILVGLAD